MPMAMLVRKWLNVSFHFYFNFFNFKSSKIHDTQFFLIAGQEKIWPILLAFNVIPSTVSCLILPWFPESPRYLLVNKGQREEAERGLFNVIN